MTVEFPPLVNRTPNTAPDVEGLIEDWLAGRPSRARGQTKVSPAGNRNLTGADGIQPALDLTPHDPRWDEAIEPRIRPVVRSLADAGFITYTSCGGHRSHEDAAPGTFMHASVGLLPQSAEESAALCRILYGAAARLPAYASRLRLTVYRTELLSTATGRRHPTLDFDFVPEAPAADYLAQLEHAMEHLAGWWSVDTDDGGKEVITVAEQSDFAGFLSELETGEDEKMATAHHSAVNVREWADKAASSDEDS